MKILHINQSDIGGGAGIAGYRLHQGLLAQGVDSKLLVNHVQTQSDRVKPALSQPPTLLEKLLWRITPRLGLKHIHTLRSFNISRHDWFQAADALNFHNLHTGYFNYLAIPHLTATKPAVFTLHDMWSFTGHCAYSYDCSKWRTGCGHCPYPDTYPAIQRDTTRLEWHLKQWVYRRSQLTIVTPSHWLTAQAQASILSRFPIHHIPYGIDTTAYQPLDPGLCKAVLGIPPHKKVLLFGAANLRDSRKGNDLLFKALQQLPPSLVADILLLTFGRGGENLANVGMPTLSLGYISSDRLKAIVFSAADLFLFPSRADNLPLILQESMACGTPMVSFKVGGIPDLVRHGVTGYLARSEDIQDFTQGVIELLEDQAKREQMAAQCRAIALTEYPIELQARRYLELYETLKK